MDDIILTFDHVSHSGEEGFLQDVSFSLRRNEHAAFFGPEGSGIETLFSLILGINEDFSGDIFFREHTIKNFNYDEMLTYRRDLGFLQKEFGLLSNMTVEENLSLPLQYHSHYTRAEIRDRVSRLIDELNLDHCKKLRPVMISESESLRAAYARSIILEPDLLLVESSFENFSQLNIQSFLRHLKLWALNSGKNIVFSTYHPEKFIDFTGRFIMLYAGKVVFNGTREEFLHSDNPYLVQFKDANINEGPMAVL